jgi:hypothetical protein
LKWQSTEWRSPFSPRDKKFRRVQSKVRKMMIFGYDYQGIMTDRAPFGTSVTAAYYCDWMRKLRRQMHKKRPAHERATHFARQCTPAPGEGCVLFAEEVRVGSVTSPTIQSRHLSTRLQLIPQVERSHAWTPFFLPGRGFCSGYPSHPRTEKRGTLNGRGNLPRCWDAVIENQGDYMEGL